MSLGALLPDHYPPFRDWGELAIFDRKVSISLNFAIRKGVSQMTKTMKKNGKKQVKKAGGKREKDPKQVEAAKKAWETIRAKAKENM